MSRIVGAEWVAGSHLLTTGPFSATESEEQRMNLPESRNGVAYGVSSYLASADNFIVSEHRRLCQHRGDVRTGRGAGSRRVQVQYFDKHRAGRVSALLCMCAMTIRQHVRF